MAVTTMSRLLDLDPATYRRHALHHADRDWPETNCYVDLWVELLHALGLDPVAGLAFVLSAGFDGDQWEFFKFPPEDLRRLYGIDVREINVWRPLADHVLTHLEMGNLLTVEVDAWFLPDTAGVSYRLAHQKTTIVPQMLDRVGCRLGYFHNSDYFELEDDDYTGALRVAEGALALPPYVELVDLRLMTKRTPADLRATAELLAKEHLSRRPSSNPVEALAAQITRDLPWLRENPGQFHAYAFGTLRQCGAWAATAASFIEWLDQPQLVAAVEAFSDMSTASKTCQFKLARVVNGRDVDLGELFERMVEAWERAYLPMVEWYGS